MIFGQGSSAIVWDSHTNNYFPMDLNMDITKVLLNPTGEVLFCGGIDGSLKMWDLRSTRISSMEQAHTAAVRSIHCNDDNLLASGGEDGRLMLWDLKNSTKLNSWKLGTNVSAVRLHRHSTHIYLIGGAYYRIALTHLGDQSAFYNMVHYVKIWSPMKKNLPGSVKAVAVTVVGGRRRSLES